MDVNQLLNLPEEQVVDSDEDLDNHLIAVYSPVNEEESDEEDVEVLPQVTTEEINTALQTLQLGEMQSHGYDPSFLRWFERYKRVIFNRRIEGLKQLSIEGYLITGQGAGQVTSQVDPELDSVASRDLSMQL